MLALVLLLSCSAHAEQAPIGFKPVTPLVYRGGRPATEVTMGFLAHHGFRTIVNLQGDAWQILPGEQNGAIQESKQLAEQFGMRFFNYPVPAGQKLDADGQQLVVDAVRAMEDPANLPVYVHCNVGADRTGLVVAAYRILHENCSFEKARDELYRNGALWSPILEDVQLPLLRELAAHPEKFGHPRTALRCSLP